MINNTDKNFTKYKTTFIIKLLFLEGEKKSLFDKTIISACTTIINNTFVVL